MSAWSLDEAMVSADSPFCVKNSTNHDCEAQDMQPAVPTYYIDWKEMYVEKSNVNERITRLNLYSSTLSTIGTNIMS